MKTTYLNVQDNSEMFFNIPFNVNVCVGDTVTVIGLSDQNIYKLKVISRNINFNSGEGEVTVNLEVLSVSTKNSAIQSLNLFATEEELVIGEYVDPSNDNYSDIRPKLISYFVSTNENVPITTVDTISEAFKSVRSNFEIMLQSSQTDHKQYNQLASLSYRSLLSSIAFLENIYFVTSDDLPNYLDSTLGSHSSDQLNQMARILIEAKISLASLSFYYALIDRNNKPLSLYSAQELSSLLYGEYNSSLENIKNMSTETLRGLFGVAQSWSSPEEKYREICIFLSGVYLHILLDSSYNGSMFGEHIVSSLSSLVQTLDTYLLQAGEVVAADQVLLFVLSNEVLYLLNNSNLDWKSKEDLSNFVENIVYD